MKTLRPVTRRNALKLGAAAAALPLVHIRTAGAAGKVSIGFWDHWVPAGNDVMKQQVQAWSDKSKVEVQADFITSNGNKLLLTAAAEAQASTGHDVLALQIWEVQNHIDKLEPVDDVVGRLSDQYGAPNKAVEYLGKSKGHWMAVPTSSGTQIKGPCGRISVLKDKAGLDIQAMYPAQPGHTAASDNWTYDTFLKAATACKAAGMPFGLGLGTTTDSVDMVGALFHAYGAVLIDGEGNNKVKSDEVRAVLEFGQKLVKQVPDDSVSYDDASNNRALISGKSPLIFNPPSAWAVALRDNPDVGKDCWTFPAPSGPKGSFTPYLPYYWGIWQFSQNKGAAKDLVEFLMQRPQVEARCTAVLGYDLPPYPKLTDFKIWEEAGPPKGSVYNYPLRPWFNSQPSLACSDASPDVAVQIYNRGTMPTMFAKLLSGQSIEQVVAWASDEVDGFTR